MTVLAFMGNISIVDGVVEAAGAQNDSSEAPDIEHTALVIYPAAQAEQPGPSHWCLHPVELSTSATSRLVSLSHAHNHGWRLRASPAYGGRRCPAPSWSESLRRKGMKTLVGAAGTVCAKRLRCNARSIRDALKTANWLDLYMRGRSPGHGAVAAKFHLAKQQQRTIDELVALRLEEEDSLNHRQPPSPAPNRFQKHTAAGNSFPTGVRQPAKGPASVQRAAPRRCSSASSMLRPLLLPAPLPRLLLPAPSPRPLLPAPVQELSLPTQISTFKVSLW